MIMFRNMAQKTKLYESQCTYIIRLTLTGDACKISDLIQPHNANFSLISINDQCLLNDNQASHSIDIISISNKDHSPFKNDKKIVKKKLFQIALVSCSALGNCT